jgi:hypothetical protein
VPMLRGKRRCKQVTRGICCTRIGADEKRKPMITYDKRLHKKIRFNEDRKK